MNLVLTAKTHQPVSMSTKLCVHDQINWSDSIKALVWQSIVRSKLKNESLLLFYLKLQSFTLSDFGAEITNSIEALAAKTTFRQLFGNDFVRDCDLHDVNQVLNYGYSFLAYLKFSGGVNKIKTHQKKLWWVFDVLWLNY